MSGEDDVDKCDPQWWVYIILCSDSSYYTGITTDIPRRFEQHENGKGAKYFYGRKPIEVVYRESGHDRSSASKREAEIKSFSRKKKMTLFEV